MILRNTASQPILIGPLELIADGSPVTSGATIQTRISGTTASGSGTLTHIASGVWEYIPTQAETDTNVLGLILSATNARTVPLTIATTRFPGQTAGVLPTVAAGANGGLPTGDSSGRVLLQPTQTGVTIPTVTTITDGVSLAANQDVRNVLGTVAGAVGSVAAGVTLASSQPNYAPSKAGDAMTLTSGERTAVANEVEAQIIDDTDSEKVLQAIVDKIAAANPSLEDLTLAAIASAIRTELSTELSRIDATITSRASQSSVNTIDDLIDTEITTIITNQGTILGNQTTIINKTNLLTTFPTNFSALSINASGHIGRVVLVDTTTTNLDMRGTDGALTSVSIPTTAEIADRYLGRNIAGGSDGGRTVKSTLQMIRNKVEINELTNVITVYAEDDVTVAWTGTVTPASSGSNGFKAIDPG